MNSRLSQRGVELLSGTPKTRSKTLPFCAKFHDAVPLTSGALAGRGTWREAPWSTGLV